MNSMRVVVITEVPFADFGSAEGALVKSEARLVFIVHPNRSKVLERAARVAEEFDLDIFVDGELTDPYEIRDRLEEVSDE